MKYFALGMIHEGIILGLNISGRDPIGEVEAYQSGIRDAIGQMGKE